MLILLLCRRSLADWSIWDYLLREVLMKRCNVLRDTRGLRSRNKEVCKARLGCSKIPCIA